MEKEIKEHLPTMEDIVYEVISEAIYQWRQDNHSEPYINKLEVKDKAIEILETEFYLNHTTNDKVRDLYIQEVKTQVFENEEDHFDV